MSTMKSEESSILLVLAGFVEVYQTYEAAMQFEHGIMHRRFKQALVSLGARMAA